MNRFCRGRQIPAILTILAGLVLAPPAGAAANVAAPRTGRGGQLDANSALAHQQHLEKKTKGKIDIYFEGDSIARRWGASDTAYADYLKNWNENFFGWNAADFAWGADQVQNILWRLENGELDNVNPKIIVFLGGTNNLSAQPSDANVADITQGIQACVDVMRKKAPDAVIILTAIFPRNNSAGYWANITKINANLAKMADGKKIRYVDVNDKMADANGILKPGIMNSDNLHPGIPGYQVWADALKPIFTEILGPPAKEDKAPPPTGDPSAAPRSGAAPATRPARGR